MRVAVVSDIHSNLHALEAVLEAIERESLDAVWCLGDIVGYGPKPDDAAASWRSGRRSAWPETTISECAGTSTSRTSRRTRRRLRCGREACSASARAAFLVALVPLAEADGVQLFHASPRDPVWEYVLTDQAAAAALELTTAALVLVGHSHVPIAVTNDGGELAGGLAPGGYGGRAGRRPLAPQPRLRRPAARRRPARGVAPPRPRGAPRPVPARPSTRSRRRRRRSARRGSRSRSPSACPRAPRR